MEISFTRFRIYRECPWKYKLVFVDGHKATLTPAAALGLSLHRALERFHRRGEGDQEALYGALDAEWLSSAFGEESDAWLKRGRRILKKYFEQERDRRSEILGVEREFIYSLGRHTVRGMIDRIDRRPDGKVELVDYKTQLSLGPQDALPEGSPAADIQLRFYALGAKRSLGISPNFIGVHYLAAGRRHCEAYDASGEAELEGEINWTADLIESGKFTPDTSFCPRCDFKNSCAYSAARTLP